MYPATTEIYTLSLHDALPILLHGTASPSLNIPLASNSAVMPPIEPGLGRIPGSIGGITALRSEEHTSELQSLRHLVCRLLLENKKEYCLDDHSYPSSDADQQS